MIIRPFPLMLPRGLEAAVQGRGERKLVKGAADHWVAVQNHDGWGLAAYQKLKLLHFRRGSLKGSWPIVDARCFRQGLIRSDRARASKGGGGRIWGVRISVALAWPPRIQACLQENAMVQVYLHHTMACARVFSFVAFHGRPVSQSRKACTCHNTGGGRAKLTMRSSDMSSKSHAPRSDAALSRSRRRRGWRGTILAKIAASIPCATPSVVKP